MMVIPMTTPGAATGLVATPINNGTVLSWKAPTSNGGSAVNYFVDENGDQVGTTTDTSITINGLANGITYNFAVTAHNQMGNGTVSSGVQVTPRPDKATVPTGVTAVPSDGQVMLSWSAPANNGGASVDYYLVYQNGIMVKNVTATSATITGLNDGTLYSYTVAAHNSAGLGDQSSVVQATPYTTANAPTGLGVIAGNGQVTLNWTAAKVDGGSAVDYYIVSQDGTALPYQLPGPSANITGLVNGQTYLFTVAGHNQAGISSQSNAKTATPFASAQSPSGLTAVPGNSKITLNWTVPLSNGGSPILDYVVYQNGVDVLHVTGLTAEITGLTYGQNYLFAVSAQNAAGIGPKSAVVTATPKPALTVPGAPIGLTATPGDRQVALSWALPDNNGGATIDYYVIYQDNVDVSHVNGSSVNITGLTNGQTYSFSIADHNVVGIGSQSIAVQATPRTLADAPSGLTVMPGNTFATLKWNAPGNGGSAIDYYVVSENGVALADQPTGLEYVVTGLTNGVSYEFTVAAHTSAGVGPSTFVNVTPAQTVPSVPLTVSSSMIDSGIVLSWAPPLDNGGYPLTYEVLRGTASGSESPLANVSGDSYTDKVMVLGANYFYIVKAVNQLGSSDASAEVGPIFASAVILLHIETESSSSIGALMTVTGDVRTAMGGVPIAGLNIDLSYSVNNGKTWIDMSSINTTSAGNFSAQWIPAATGDYMLKGSWAGNAVYQKVSSVISLDVETSSDKYVFTVQSNSTISDLSFNSDTKVLTFNVSGEPGTYGYSRIAISKEIVANGSDITVTLDGAVTSYTLTSTNSSWVLYFAYHHSTHSIVATLVKSDNAGTGNSSPLPLFAIVGLAVVSALMVAGLVILNKRRSRK